MARVVLPESGLRARRRRRRMFVAVGAWAACVAVIAGIIALSHAPFLRITTIEISGGKTVAAEALESTVRELLSGSYFYLVPRNNIFLYPKEDLGAALVKAYPTLREVSVHAQNFTTVALEAQDREPRALWCGENFERTEQCVLLDEEGTAYALAPDFSENPYVHYYGPLAGGDLPGAFLTPERFRALSALVDALAQAQHALTVEGVAVDEVGDARLRFANGFALLFALADDGGDVFERFSLALTAEPFKERTLDDFEYLDLRFGDKLYYKAKEHAQEESASTQVE